MTNLSPLGVNAVSTRKKQLLCNVVDKEIECYDSSGEKVPVKKRIVGNMIILMYANEELFNYEVKVESHTRYRVLCNGELFGEFTWGSKRYSMWETLTPVDKLLCLIGSFNIDKHDPFIYNTDLVKHVEEKLSFYTTLWNIIRDLIKWPVKQRYLLVTNTIVNEPIVGVIRVDNNNFTFDLVYSSITLMLGSIIHVERNRVNTFIQEVARALLGEDSIISLLGFNKLDSETIKELLSFSNKCFSMKSDEERILLENNCNTAITLFIRTEKCLLKTILEKHSRYHMDKNLLGEIYEYFIVKKR